jgi:hypothetical protein
MADPRGSLLHIDQRLAEAEHLMTQLSVSSPAPQNPTQSGKIQRCLAAVREARASARAGLREL